MCVFAANGQAQTPITQFQGLVGHYDFVTTGGSLRADPNTVNSCSTVASSTNPLSGIPAPATITAAYLYWAGSGSAVDSTVSLNGNSVTASRTFTATFVFNGTDYDFFGGFADVTPLVTGNGVFTFTGLTFNSGSPHCPVSAVMAGW